MPAAATAFASSRRTRSARRRFCHRSPRGARRLRPVLASISSTFTSQVASHGAYAVFVLMAIDAVFPAASELVMLYAGAVAAGVFPGTHHVSLFGAKVGFGIGAFIVMALAGTLGYLVGALVGWWIGAARRPPAARAPRPLAARHAGAARPRRALVRALGEPRRARRPRHAGRPLVRLDPGRRLRDAARALRALTVDRLGDLGLRDRRRGLRARLELRALPPRLQVRRVRDRGRRSRARGVSHLSIKEGRYSEAP